jgi:hypothetical protein
MLWTFGYVVTSTENLLEIIEQFPTFLKLEYSAWFMRVCEKPFYRRAYSYARSCWMHSRSDRVEHSHY